MPSPFPGMDPYLERKHWLDFHASMAVAIKVHLNPQLRPKYTAMVNQRTVLADYERETRKERDRYPDVSVVREATVAYGARSGSAVADPPVVLKTHMPFEEPHRWVEILRAEDEEIVTAIEVLSPANKIGRGREEYLKKREELLLSSVHLLEIDLQRAGQRLPVEGDLPPAAYYVFLSRENNRPKTGIWPIQLSEPLPTVPVPLERPDPDVALDLQKIVKEIYEQSNYDVVTDYSAPPPGLLTDDESRFVKECLAKAGKA